MAQAHLAEDECTISLKPFEIHGETCLPFLQKDWPRLNDFDPAKASIRDFRLREATKTWSAFD